MINKANRDYSSNPELDCSEHQWWNENSQIISAIWEMDEEISWEIRKNYINKITHFFQTDNGKSGTIFEIGCGSGWLGQFIASPKIKIIGTDFSEEQIHLAKSKAQKKKIDDFCFYYTLKSNEWPSDIKNVDLILIHCILHHLDKKEIDIFFNNLKLNLKSGTKVWIYEPAFYVNTTFVRNDDKIKVKTRLAYLGGQIIANSLTKFLEKFNLIDEKLYQQFINLSKNADEKGWYLSPKEIPFDVNEFSNYLMTKLYVRTHYWQNLFGIGWVFTINLIKKNYLRRIIGKGIIPFFNFFDNQIVKDETFIRNNIILPRYAFHVWEGILK